MPVIEALPPQSLDAEENLIGACMLSEKAIEKCADIVTAQAFYRASHGAIYDAILSLYGRGSAVDLLTVVEELTKTGKLDEAGGADRVYELGSLVPSASNAAHYATIVKDTWIARELASAGREILRLGMERPGEMTDLVDEADARMVKVQRLLEQKNDTVFTSKQLVADFRRRLAESEDDTGIETPFPRSLNRFKAGRLYVLGGYSKDGKSALALQFVRSACEAGARVGFASIEMNHQDLTDRLVATFGVPHSHIMAGDVGRYEQVVEDALGQIEQWSYEVIDDVDLTPSSIRRAQRRGKYDFLVIDHLHNIRIKDRRHEREELSDNVLQITAIARDFEIPVLLLSQLSRGMKHDPYPRPSMADVRGTSVIENQASMVMFVWRKREQGQRTNVAELIIAANRHGQEGFQNLTFNDRYVRFEAA